MRRQSKVTALVETNAGPDMSLLQFNWPWLYDQKLVDLTDIATDLGMSPAAAPDAALRPW